MAETAVSMLPWPEIITIGSSGCCPFIASSNCSPSSRLPCSQMSRNTRFGLRLATCASASSLSRAERVMKPSSCRMPDTSSRMSASSSTMRMSSAMGSSIRCELRGLGSRRGLGLVRAHGFRREAQPHPGSALAGDLFGGIAELDASAVVLQDAAYDGEAQAGALLAGGDVGFEQPAAVLLRQPDP